MSSYFPISIMVPSKARLAKGPTKVRVKHPWKTMKKRSKAPRKLSDKQVRAMVRKYAKPLGGRALE